MANGDVTPSSPWVFPLFPERASSMADDVDVIYFAIVGFSVLFTLVICGLILIFAYRYRASREDVPRLKGSRRSWPLEVAWIGVPLIAVTVIFIWSAWTYLEIMQPPAGARVVYVVGKQWMWKVQHTSGPREINTLHVPVGEPVRLIMTSQDVIHSFYIPAFRVKQDVLPGRYTTLWFKPTRPGEYHLLCAEYCGNAHSRMRGKIIAMEPADFQAWLNPSSEGPIPGTPGTPTAPMALRGENIWHRLGCPACHTPDSPVRAPRLEGLYMRQRRLINGELVIGDEGYIRESILNPQAKIVAGYDAPSLMPSYAGQISEAEVQELIEFIKSLQHGWPIEAQEVPGQQPRGTDESGENGNLFGGSRETREDGP